MKKRKNLKFLSQSVLLEESGLPRINTLIIVVVFVMVVSFITWSMVMKIDDVTTVKGFLVQEQNKGQKISFSAKIPSKEILLIKQGLSVSINIPGVMDKNTIMGTIDYIDKTPMIDSRGDVYYKAVVKASNDIETLIDINKIVIPSMEINVNVITGSKTLFQHFLGPIFNSVG